MLRRAEESFWAAMIFWGVGNLEKDSFFESEDVSAYVLSHFEQAMDEGWIQIYYQPVIRSITGSVCGAEALCRWIDPGHGLISPGQMIPVLERSGKIFELDLYIAECVCRDFRDILQKKNTIIPVSINLSRKDFLHEDIVERIESIASWYQVPRELINIEITESAFIQQQSALASFVAQFHQLGYQVWMDDFGTAYSSLGALKDLSFDELKIDMSFLSDSSPKARIILSDVVRMAKQIGIQTLAEGVETKEQYEFLRQIGCEKIQGFYFGRPMPGDAFYQHCQDHGLWLEHLRWKKYYDDLGRIDYQTDDTLCVVEDDGRKFQPLFVNAVFRKVMKKAGIPDLEEWFDDINATDHPAHDFFRRFANEQLRKLPGSQSITFPHGNHYLQLSGRVAARFEDKTIYRLKIRSVDLEKKTPYQQNAAYLNQLYFLWDDINVFDLAGHSIYGLKSSLSDHPLGAGDETKDPQAVIESWISHFVYPLDQDRARKFLDFSTLSDRLQNAGGRGLGILLRCLDENGQFVWKQNLLLSVSGTDHKVLNVIVPVSLDEHLIQQILQETIRRSEVTGNLQKAKEQGITSALLWENQKMYSSQKIFWKDSQRRFAGVSQSFLDYYGFASEADLLGKTDEEMHWHVQKDPFRDDELDIISRGTRTHQRIGSCIAKGVQHTIVASKMPIYWDGRIVGLMGRFTDQDEILESAGKIDQIETVDPVTKLSNTTGFLYSFRLYLRQLWEHGESFVLMHIAIPEYQLFLYTYGLKAGQDCLRGFAGVFCDVLGRENVVGRITGAHFFALLHDKSPAEVEQLSEEIRERIRNLRQIQTWKFAGTAVIESHLLNEKNVSRDNFADAVYEMLKEFGRDHQE